MKKAISILIATLLLSSCGEDKGGSIDSLISEGNIKDIRTRKNELSERQKKLETDIHMLDSVLAALGGEKNLPLVSALTVKEQLFNHYLELQGAIMTKQNVLIYPESAGTLLKVYVKEGDKVRKGQLLANIDDGGMASQLSQLKTQAALAKTTFERQKRLWDQKIGSEIQYLQAKATFEAQENAVKQVQSQLGRTTIRAPFSGIIDNVIKTQGTVVIPGPGSEVFRIVNLSDMYVQVDVPENYLKSVTKGKVVNVYFPVLGDTVVTSIRETGNFINPANRSFSIEIPVPNPEGIIKPNLTAKIRINDYSVEKALLIPQSIISENSEGKQYVYTVVDTGGNGELQAKRSIISTGKIQDSFVEILSGIAVGDQLIVEGARNVKDGQQIKISN